MILLHFSENPNISVFEVSHHRPFVWAVDEKHAPNYYFPRDCPRICYWITSESTLSDVNFFFSHTSAKWVVAIESDWLEQVRHLNLYMYHLPSISFQSKDINAGYYVSNTAVEPLSVEPVGDLLIQIIQANIELRVTPSLWKLYHAVSRSSLGFSIIRMRNAKRAEV